MKKLGFLCLLVIIVQVFLNTEASRLNDVIRRKEDSGRVKRAWSYQPVKVDEFIRDASYFEPYPLVPVDNDDPRVVSYKITGDGVDLGLFSLEGKNIWLKKPLDFEVQSEYFIQAYAYDGSGTEVDKPTTITIVVIDLNDNYPIFDRTTLSGVVQEDVAIGTRVMNIDMSGPMKIVANDADSDYNEFGVVRFYVNGEESPAGNRFAVTRDGYVTVVGELDYETEPEITFPVQARDSFEDNSYTPKTADAEVHITVLDGNDHAPQFVGVPYETSVGELLDVGSTVFTVRAVDGDVGINSAVSFEIIKGDTKKQFDIKSNPVADKESSGQIILLKPLDYELGPRSYTLDIRGFNKDATNSDNSKFYSVTTVQITITDENEPPIFENTPYSGNIRENTLDPQKTIATVQARDPDFGGQAVTYSIVSTEGWFSINKETGVVKNIAEVDRENIAVNQETSIYDLMVRATDDYNPAAYNQIAVAIRIVDLNDNPPGPLGGTWNAQICETPKSSNVTVITAVDRDSSINGPPFTFNILDKSGLWLLETLSDTSALIMTHQTQFNLNDKTNYEVPISIVDTPSSGESAMTGTGTLTVNICRCNSEGVMDCTTTGTVAGAGFPVAVVVGIIAAILILLIIVLAVVAYRRNRDAELLKQPILLDDDDVRENLQAYHDEGGGEEDNDAYDISALQNPPLIDPKRQDEPPLTNAQPQPRSRIPPNTDIGDYIGDAKNQADNDPTAPPFDSLLVFDYEGAGSDAGSLSSLNSGTTDGSQDYDHLNNWGPRFKKLADMYGGGESD